MKISFIDILVVFKFFAGLYIVHRLEICHTTSMVNTLYKEMMCCKQERSFSLTLILLLYHKLSITADAKINSFLKSKDLFITFLTYNKFSIICHYKMYSIL